jgi:hypothetical protein
MIRIQVDKSTFYIPDKDSPCALWKSYFQKLKEEVGRDNAKLIWLVTWDENGAISCTTNPEFNSFLKKNDIDVSNQATRAVAGFSELGQNVLGFGKSLTKMLSIGLPIALGSTLVFILFILVKTAQSSDVKDLAALALPANKLLKG